MRSMRLDRLLTRAGVTRREAAALVRAGRVTVNGQPAASADVSVDLDADRVSLGGEAVRTDAHFYIMLNKPSGVITAVDDSRAETVMSLLPKKCLSWGLAPVGRLDRDVTGLLLLTDDGQLAHRLISPRWEQPKRYVAWVEGRVGEQAVRQAAAGIALSDFTCKPAILTILSAADDHSLCALTVTEGKYHQVKRMMAALGHPVIELRRETMGPLTLDPGLSEGAWRELTETEVASLYDATELTR